MTAEQALRAYEPVIRGMLGRYADHPQWDDLYIACAVEIWQMLSRMTEDERDSAVRLVQWKLRHSIAEWMRSQENASATKTRRKSLPPVLSLDALLQGDAEGDERNRVTAYLVTPDFAPALVERLWSEWVSEEARKAMTPWQWDAAWGHARGLLFHKMAAARGRKKSADAENARKGYARARKALEPEDDPRG